MDVDVKARITKLRKSKGISVNKLAEISGISQSYLRDIEIGNKENPTIGIIENICQGLGISLAEFFADENELSFKDSRLMQTIYLLSPEQQKALDTFLTSIMVSPPNKA